MDDNIGGGHRSWRGGTNSAPTILTMSVPAPLGRNEQYHKVYTHSKKIVGLGGRMVSVPYLDFYVDKSCFRAARYLNVL